jgi:hypothetical protein
LTIKVKAMMVYWAKERDRCGLDLDANHFTDVQVRETIARMMVENTDDKSKPELPSKFNVNKWVLWSKRVENYLWQIKGPNNTPMVYVIRKPRAANAPPFATMEEERMYQIAHNGPAFIRDNQRVFGILYQLLGGNAGYTWISKYETLKD